MSHKNLTGLPEQNKTEETLHSENFIATNSNKNEPYADRNNLRNLDAELHLRAQTRFIDDIPLQEGTLHAVVFGSPIAHGKIIHLDTSKAEKAEGVVAILTAKDVTGENQIGDILPDEPLFADGEVLYNGQPVALVVAETQALARRALDKIEISLEELPVITTPREAYQQNQLIMNSRTFSLGDTEGVWNRCEFLFSGSAKMDGQEHLYLETQGAYVYPTEAGNLKVFSSTQGASYVQLAISEALGLPMNRIEVDVRRLGGGFGGKEAQANTWASLTALAAYRLDRPVKLILDRADDLRMTGKRHPYEFDYQIGFDKDFKIIAYEVECYQNAGAVADVSPAVMERTLFHGGSSYYLPNAKITVHSCRTNLPPNTAFRGFGAPQAMFVMEAALDNAAEKLGVDLDVLQKINLLSEGDEFPYGQTATDCNARACFESAEKSYKLEQLKKEIAAFNESSERFKKGFSTFPLCFGISFTNTALNQAGALAHIYKDGSVSVSTGVVEMGQSANTKIMQVASQTLHLPPNRIKIDSTNTSRVANQSPTAASTGADLNGKAAQMACTELYKRLMDFARTELGASKSARLELLDEVVHVDGQKTELDWNTLVFKAYWKQIDLSCHAYYKTPDIHFDKTKEKGEPFAYHVYGTAITVVRLDCLRGVYDIEAVHIVHDFGNSINTHLDRGQIEGALVQGIGLMSIEELIFNPDGSLRSDSLSSYKVPDIHFTPELLDIKALETTGPEKGLLRSKAVGEPPLCYGIGTYFAVLNAIRAFNPKLKAEHWAPITYQKTLLNLYPKVLS